MRNDENVETAYTLEIKVLIWLIAHPSPGKDSPEI